MTKEEYRDDICCCCEYWDLGEPDGVCPECGFPTVEGYAVVGCEYSPVICETCWRAPCDGYC